jgi:hypothetical protein
MVNVAWNENPKVDGQEETCIGRADCLRAEGWANRIVIDCAEISAKPTELRSCSR